MEFTDSSVYSSSSSESFQGLKLVQYPCAACKILRRRCSERCVLSPYFPPSEPLKFIVVHKIFGASNMIKRLQEIPEHKRMDAVDSMVYEATARIRDPVYGCAGAVISLHQQNMELQEELAKAQAEIFNLKRQNDKFVSSICLEMSSSQEQQPLDNTNIWCLEPFWTFEQLVDM